MTGRYLSLYRSGELARRAAALEARLANCDICPRACGVNRSGGETGYCRSASLPVVTSVLAHHGEEPVLSGRRGSGTIFFGNCNLRCRYCQNYQISQELGERSRYETDIPTLASHMLRLQDEGCHNINFVSPSHFVPQIVAAVLAAIPRGLSVPLVYNSSGYDALETIRQLDGIIDIYLPDLRYGSDDHARKYSDAPGYPETARAAIREMYRQVGELKTDETGIAERGLIVRHLILPNDISGSRDCLEWLAQELSPRVAVSIMSQYHPCYHAFSEPQIARRITGSEYEKVVEIVTELGLENGWLQEMESAEHYLPDFNDRHRPFG